LLFPYPTLRRTFPIGKKGGGSRETLPDPPFPKFVLFWQGFRSISLAQTPF